MLRLAYITRYNLTRYPPDRATDVVGHQQRAAFVHCQAHRAAMGGLAFNKASQHIFGHPAEVAVCKGHEHDLIAVEFAAVPSAMLADKGATAIMSRQSIARVQSQAQRRDVARQRIEV